MDYLDFELEILPGNGREYPIAVLRSPAGEVSATLQFPFDQITLENRLDKLQIALLRSGGKRRSGFSDEERAVQEFGQALFDAVFTGEVRSRYDVSCERAAQKEQGVRLKLRIQAPELAILPWEFLYDPRQGEYLCLSRNTPLVRYLELDQPIPSLKVNPPLRILGMIASPSDETALDAAREKQRVEIAVADLRARGLVDLTWLEGQTWHDLQRAMRGGPWHIFHFVGHGAYDSHLDEGLIVLAGSDGRSEYMTATQVARLLANHRSLRLVVLNACEGARGGKRDVFSSTASILVRRNIPAVIAMQYAITDEAAIEFGRAFYEALADGLPVDAAASEARTAVSMQVTNTVEWGTPVLYMRTPDGVLFDMAAPSVPMKPVPLFTERLAQNAVPLEPPVASASIRSTPVQDEQPVPVAAAAEPPAPKPRSPASISTQPAADGIAREPVPAVLPLPSRSDSSRPRWRWVAVVAALGVLGMLYYIVFRLWSYVPSTTPPISADTSTSSRPMGQIAPAPGATMIWPVADMVMVWVPTGRFTMGSSNADTTATAEEMPQHTVYVEGFWMSRTEVTNAQYAACVRAGACGVLVNKDYNRTEFANQPVRSVSWHDANEYGRWVGGRLPTEAEWEKACRGTDGRIYPWGNEIPTDELLNYNHSVESVQDVGSYPKGASPFGLLDMAGNVSEWTSSLWGEDFFKPTFMYPYNGADGREDQTAPDGVLRVLRGGAFDAQAVLVRCALRNRWDPGLRGDSIGFRVVASLSHS